MYLGGKKGRSRPGARRSETFYAYDKGLFTPKAQKSRLTEKEKIDDTSFFHQKKRGAERIRGKEKKDARRHSGEGKAC